MNLFGFSLARFGAVVNKEFIQMRRDRLTLAMMIGIPLFQLVMFGYAINTDPKHLPTALVVADESVFSRNVVQAVKNTGYFRIVGRQTSEGTARELLQKGDVQFVISIPEDFSRSLVRGERPSLLVEADATDPVASGNALVAVDALIRNVLGRDLPGSLESLQEEPPAIDLRIHKKYNPEGITQYNIVPGLMGVVLSNTMVIITALAISREKERGTMENLLSTPVRPSEVMLGKIVPYILVGYVQMTLILVAAHYVFEVPLMGSVLVLYGVTLLFIAANLAVGVTFSTVAGNQLQAVQMAFFFFLPSIMLSGFMFPFRGMPEWAQWVGSILPLTHYLRLVRGIMLKGFGFQEVMTNLWPIALFMVLAIWVGLKRYKQTLD